MVRVPIATCRCTQRTCTQFSVARLTHQAAHLDSYTDNRVVGVPVTLLSQRSQTLERDVNPKTKNDRSDILTDLIVN